MPVQPAAVELLAALAPVAQQWGRWYVFGAQAVVVYGVPRLSADVDVTLALVPDAPERFARDMQAAGFSLRVLLEEALSQGDLVSSFDTISGSREA